MIFEERSEPNGLKTKHKQKLLAIKPSVLDANDDMFANDEIVIDLREAAAE